MAWGTLKLRTTNFELRTICRTARGFAARPSSIQVLAPNLLVRSSEFVVRSFEVLRITPLPIFPRRSHRYNRLVTFRLLGVLLLVWEPLNFAAQAMTVLPTLAARGLVPGVELLLHGIVAALSAAAGLAVLNGTPASHRLATVAVLASCARTIQSVSFTSLPSETVPGQEPYVVIAALTLTVLALAIIRRSTRSSR